MAAAARSLPVTWEPDVTQCYPSLTQEINRHRIVDETPKWLGLIGPPETPYGHVYNVVELNRAPLFASPFVPGETVYIYQATAPNYVNLTPSPVQAESVVPKVQRVRPLHLIRQLQRISDLGTNWDGDGAEKPTDLTVSNASNLVELAFDVSEAMSGIDPTNSAWSNFYGFLPSFNASVDPGLSARVASLTGNLPEMAGILSTTTQIFHRPEIISESDASLYPTVDGGVTLKWIYQGRELKCTVTDDTVEVIRWKSNSAYDSDGLWDLTVGQTREHFEWLMR